MEKSRRYIRSTVRMALTWAASGALLGALVELLNDLAPNGLPCVSLVDVWPPLLAIAGFLGGAVVASVPRLAGVRRSQ